MRPIANAKPVSEGRLIELFEKALNDFTPQVRIAEFTCEAATALKRIDPVAYHQTYLNWIDEVMSDGFFKYKGQFYDICDSDKT